MQLRMLYLTLYICLFLFSFFKLVINAFFLHHLTIFSIPTSFFEIHIVHNLKLLFLFAVQRAQRNWHFFKWKPNYFIFIIISAAKFFHTLLLGNRWSPDRVRSRSFYRINTILNIKKYTLYLTGTLLLVGLQHKVG